MPTVWIVMNESSSSKDFSDARQYGELRVVFVRAIYGDFEPLKYAVKVMQDYQDGDYILTTGDPMATGIVTEVALAASESQILTYLRWDRRSLKYIPFSVDFGGLEG